MGTILDIQGADGFKVRAYETAGRAIRGLTEPLARLEAEGRLDEIPGIGKSIAEKIRVLLSTGDLPAYREIVASVPPGIVRFLEIEGLGPKKVRRLWEELGLETVEALKQACQDGRVAALAGFGAKSQEKILKGIEFLDRNAGAILLGEALPVAKALLAGLRACPAVRRASLAGSIRRGKEVIGDIDLVASSDDPEAVMDAFVALPGVEETIARGPTKTSVHLEGGFQSDLRVVTDDQFTACLLYFTGSKEHNVALRALAQTRGYKINEYGVFAEGSDRPESISDEAAFFRFFGLDWVPPELRENRGEVDAAARGALPELLDPGAIRGILHCHSTWSDGKASIEQMALAARARGWEYLGISDHSKSAFYAGGLDERRLAEQASEIDALNERLEGIRLLKGSEVDILDDGSLDFDDEVLAGLDFVVASVHSKFKMSEEAMTDRIVRAVRHPLVTCLGHPTGRLLLSREPYAVDLGRVVEAAAASGCWLEINGNPRRLDLDAIWARRAAEAGVPILIGPDAHSVAGLDDTEYGVLTARRAWLGAEGVMNTRSLDELLEAIARRRNPAARGKRS